MDLRAFEDLEDAYGGCVTLWDIGVDHPRDVPILPFVGWHKAFRSVPADPYAMGAALRTSNRLSFVWTITRDNRLPDGYANVGGAWLYIEPDTPAELWLHDALSAIRMHGGPLNIADYNDREDDVRIEKVHYALKHLFLDHDLNAAIFVADLVKHGSSVRDAYDRWVQHQQRTDDYSAVFDQ